jgi:hypothetical protein
MGIDARLAAVAAAPPTRLAEIVRESHREHYGKASSFVRWDPTGGYEHLVHLQQVAVCFGGKQLAGTLPRLTRPLPLPLPHPHPYPQNQTCPFP